MSKGPEKVFVLIGEGLEGGLRNLRGNGVLSYYFYYFRIGCNPRIRPRRSLPAVATN
jgi:hypothetical protein